MLQQWLVPSKDECDEAILYEDVKFVKTSYDKDTGNKKRKASNPTSSKVKNPTPQFAREIKPDDVKKLAASLNKSQPSYLSELLESNNFQPHPYEEIHNSLPSKIRCVEKKQDACNKYDCKVRDEMLKQLPQSKTMTQEKIFKIEKNTREQSSSDQWFDERKIRLTASNFGAVIKRKISIYPKSLLGKIQNPPKHCNPPTLCKWGMGQEENAIKHIIT